MALRIVYQKCFTFKTANESVTKDMVENKYLNKQNSSPNTYFQVDIVHRAEYWLTLGLVRLTLICPIIVLPAMRSNKGNGESGKSKSLYFCGINKYVKHDISMRYLP